MEGRPLTEVGGLGGGVGLQRRPARGRRSVGGRRVRESGDRRRRRGWVNGGRTEVGGPGV